MSGQLSYTYQTPKGVAGALVDITAYSIDSRMNGEIKTDAMLFGMGAVAGNNPGKDVLVPTDAATADKFEGVIMTGYTQQMTMSGEVHCYPSQTVGVLRWGRAWARVADDITPEYGDALYLIKTGDDAGCFTNTTDETTNIAVNGRFIGGLGNGNIAPVEIYNQKV